MEPQARLAFGIDVLRETVSRLLGGIWSVAAPSLPPITLSYSGATGPAWPSAREGW